MGVKRGQNRGSSSVINIVESPEVIMLSSDETEGDEMVGHGHGKGFAEEDTWSSGSETSNSSDPDFKPRKGRGRNK